MKECEPYIEWISKGQDEAEKRYIGSLFVERTSEGELVDMTIELFGQPSNLQGDNIFLFRKIKDREYIWADFDGAASGWEEIILDDEDPHPCPNRGLLQRVVEDAEKTIQFVNDGIALQLIIESNHVGQFEVINNVRERRPRRSFLPQKIKGCDCDVSVNRRKLVAALERAVSSIEPASEAVITGDNGEFISIRWSNRNGSKRKISIVGSWKKSVAVMPEALIAKLGTSSENLVRMTYMAGHLLIDNSVLTAREASMDA